MKKKTEKQVDYYTDEPIGKVKIVKDFLPKPQNPKTPKPQNPKTPIE